MRQFWLLIFSFPERLDGCAMIWVSKPALSGDQFALRVSLVEELFPPLSCTHPIHQRLQCVLERRFCKERWMINRVGVHSQTCYEDQINITSTITCGSRLNSNTNSLLKWTGAPMSDTFFWIHTILHDILGFDTIYHTIFAIFWKVKFGKKFTWNSRQMRKINMKAFLDA